jgi:hypothetical protein
MSDPKKERPLRVWWLYSYRGGKSTRVLVAARTQKAAAKALGIPLGYFREYVMETGNARDLELALRTPGRVCRVTE